MGRNEAIKYLMEKYAITYNCAAYYMHVGDDYMPTAGSLIRQDIASGELRYND